MLPTSIKKASLVEAFFMQLYKLPDYLSKKVTAQVTISPIAGYEYDKPFLYFIGYPKRSTSGTPTAHTSKNAFFPGQPARGIYSILLRNVHDPVYPGRFKYFWKVGHWPT